MKKQIKKIKKVVDNLTQWCYYNQVAASDGNKNSPQR